MCAVNRFFGQDNELQIYDGNFHLMDNKHMTLFVIKQPKRCKFAKMHQNAFGDRALPGPAGGAYKLPRLPSRNGAATSNGRELAGQSM